MGATAISTTALYGLMADSEESHWGKQVQTQRATHKQDSLVCQGAEDDDGGCHLGHPEPLELHLLVTLPPNPSSFHVHHWGAPTGPVPLVCGS